jgi:Flp pilus assembly pilin Flp
LRVETTREEDVMELVNRMRAFVREDSGQDLLEYALLVGLIALVCVLAVTNAGTAIGPEARLKPGARCEPAPWRRGRRSHC